MRTFLLFILFSTLIPFSYSSNPLNTFLDAHALRSASVGILLINSTKGDTIIDYNKTKSLAPASVMKLVTTSTALELLEPNFKFGTKFYVSARSGLNGTLYGKLIIQAAGDPTWASEYFDISPEMVFDVIEKMLRQQNITKIDGGIETNVSIFDSQVIPPGWIWEDIGNYYAPGTYSMAWRDNTFKIHLKSGAPGTDVEVLKTDPIVKGLKLRSFVKAAHNQKDSAYIYGAPYSYNQFISGTIPAFRKDFVIKGSFPNPAEQFNHELVNYLNSKGIEVKNAVVTNRNMPDNAKLIKAIFSPPLHEIVKVTNKESVNLYAEYLLKHLSLKSSYSANREKSIDMVYDFWRKNKIDVSSIRIQDGSGLSPKNLVTADFMVSMLDYMRQKSFYAEYFLGSLPISSKDGTLKNFAKGTSLEHRIFAKSGSMQGVRCYAGYIHGLSNDVYTFCVLINNYLGNSQTVVNLTEDLLVESVK